MKSVCKMKCVLILPMGSYIIYNYSALVLIDQSHCIDWIFLCYIRSLNYLISGTWFMLSNIKKWLQKMHLKTLRSTLVSSIFRQFGSCFWPVWCKYILCFATMYDYYIHILNRTMCCSVSLNDVRPIMIWILASYSHMDSTSMAPYHGTERERVPFTP